MIDDLVRFLEQIADEDLELARMASSSPDGRDVEAVPERWEWCSMTGAAVRVDPNDWLLTDTDPAASVPGAEYKHSVCLRTAQRTDVIAHAQEVSSAAGAHMIRHDPAAVASRVAGLRVVLAEARRVSGSAKAYPVYSNFASVIVVEQILKGLALEHAHRPGYDPAWIPQA